jgi:GNAT superfamily N-acetyltransferase
MTTPYYDNHGIQHVGSLYVDKNWHGKGVGAALMQKVIEWFDPTKPIELGVAVYNERAKAFYRKWGFEEIPGSESLFADKIPEIRMVRKALTTGAQK